MNETSPLGPVERLVSRLEYIAGNGEMSGSDDLAAVVDAIETIKRLDSYARSLGASLDSLAECRDIAMEWTLRGRIPECGKFGEIAQDLDAAMQASLTANT